jgi:DNA gyrase/topoisomerase IV subunit B
MAGELQEPLHLHIRRRPGMYIGGANSRGLRFMLDDVVTSLVELPGGPPERVRCTVGADGAYGVEVAGACGAVEPEDFVTFGGDADYPLHALAIVAAMSARLDAEVVRDGRRWRAAFAAGAPVGRPEVSATTAPPAVRLRYRPDPELFPPTARVECLALCGRAREWAAFNPSVRFTTDAEADGQRRDFHYPEGLLSLAREIEHERTQFDAASGAWRCRVADDAGSAEAVLFFNSGARAVIHSFVNGMRTTCDGSHVDGLRAAVADILARSAADDDEDDVVLDVEDGENGSPAPWTDDDPLGNLTVLLSVRLRDPAWRYATKVALGDPRAYELVRRMVATLPEDFGRMISGRY